MKVEWRVDPVVNRALWERLSLFPRELMSGISPRVVLDLGGGSGDFASSLLQDGRTMVISLDTDLDVLKKRVKGVQAVLGDATSLPIKDSSVGGVTARAVLHHFPKDAEKCLFEAERVLKGGGLFLVQEPLSHNFLANIARRYFLTKRHETGEEPFDPSQLKTILSNHFQPQWKEYHFLFSYLTPHVTCRVRSTFKLLARKLSIFLQRLDEKVLRVMPGLRKHSAYVTILSRKEQKPA